MPFHGELCSVLEYKNNNKKESLRRSYTTCHTRGTRNDLLRVNSFSLSLCLPPLIMWAGIRQRE